jgi:hypothetical protein
MRCGETETYGIVMTSKNQLLRRLAARAGLISTVLAGITAGALAQTTPGKVRMPEETPASLSRTEELRAGPIRLKFADGELRYLYVGDREIIRRIYFAVRNGGWETATPVFTQMDVQSRKDSFTVHLKADCTTVAADYHWTAIIEGTPTGRITFHATGTSGQAFRSNRIGLCVLFGAPALAGHGFETTGETGATLGGAFPEYVSPQLVAGKFRALRYKTPDGMAVTTSIGGTLFDMEDQRTYDDSSYKAYAPVAYAYPNIPAGTPAEESVTVSVENVPAHAAIPSDVTEIRLGKILPEVRLPKIEVIDAAGRGGIFGDVNGRRERYAGAKTVTWGFAPSIHLLDNDTFFENVWSLPDQVRSAHAYAPGASIVLDPIVINSHARKPEDDRRNGNTVGAAWSASLIREMAIAGVAEGRFGMGPGLASALQTELAAYAGKPLYATTITGPLPSPVDVLAIDVGGKPLVYLINRSEKPRKAVWHGATGSVRALSLAPYEVRKITD